MPRATTKKRSRVATQTQTMAQPSMTAKQLSHIFVAFLIGHSLVIYLANRFFPMTVVLGNHVLSPTMAVLSSMVVFTLIAVGAIPVIEHLAESQRRRLSSFDWMTMFTFINAGGLWLVTRFAEQLGLGVSSWLAVVILALVMDVVQGLLVMKVIDSGK